MTREKAIEWYNTMMKGMTEGDVKEALQMGLDALKAQEPEEDYCEACQIHYPEDNES